MRKLALSMVVASVSLAAAPAWAQEDLQPPPPVNAQPAPPRNATEAELQKSEKEDTGLGLEWVWLNADAGFSFIDLKSFSESQLAVTDTNKSGTMFGFGAGVRLLFLTLGLRARNHSAFNLWQINGEVGLHMRFWRIDPYLAIRGGYDTVGTFNQSVTTATSGGNVPSSSGIDVHGWNVGAALGLDIYFTSLLSIGAEAAGDVLFLKRPPAPLPTTDQLPAQVKNLPQAQQDAYIQQLKSNPLYQNSGSSVGFGGALSLHLGVHF